MKPAARLANSSQRTTVVGRTGTGKTIAAIFQLSKANLKKPWVVFNFKNDHNIDNIPNVQHIDFDYVPKKKDSGLFVLNPSMDDIERPYRDEKSEMEKYVRKIWERGGCGIFSDEGYMMRNNNAFITCLTQGRSLEIPMITGVQRPAWVTRFVFSEADFFQIFDLNMDDDKNVIEGFTSIRYKNEPPLQDYWSLYYDVGKNKLWKFKPVPNVQELYDVFDRKLEKRKTWI